MGMQCHFLVSELTELEPAMSVDKEIDQDGCHYIIVNHHFAFSCDEKYENAWFDVGQMSASAMVKLRWLIQNRVCFSCS